VVFNTEPYTVLPDNSILNTANMQSETGFPSSHQLKSYVTSKSRLKLAASAVLSADAGLLVIVLYTCAIDMCIKLLLTYLLTYMNQREDARVLLNDITYISIPSCQVNNCCKILTI